MESKLFPNEEACKSLSESNAVKYLNNVIDKLEQSLNSSKSVDIHDLIFRLANSYFDYYNKFIDRICKEFISRDVTKLIYDVLKTLTNPIDVTNETTKLTLEFLINFSDHSKSIVDKIKTSKILELIIDSLLNEKLTDVKNDRTNEIVECHLRIISNFARDINNVLTYRIVEIKNILVKFIKFNCNDSLGLISVFTLSYLIDDADAGLLDDALKAINILIKQIENTMKTNKRSGGFTLYEMLHGLYCISTNDTMKEGLVKQGVLPLLVKIMKDYKGEVIEPTLGTIEKLCFNDKIKMKLMKEYKIEEIAKKFINSECSNIQQHAHGILWKVQDLDKQTHDKLKSSEISFDVFISYSWANKEKVLKIVDDFKKNNIRFWIDEEQMRGSSLEAMATGIERSQLIIMAVSSSYKKSPNCRHEAEYAFQIKKSIIPVVMELNYKASNWLGFIIGCSIYYELSERRNIREEIMKIRSTVKTNLTNSIEFGNEIKQCHVSTKKVKKSLENNAEKHSNIEKWSSEDVQRWLETSDFGHLKGAFIKVDGSLLQILLEIRSNSSDYFNKVLQSEFGMKFVDVLSFHKILNQLSYT